MLLAILSGIAVVGLMGWFLITGWLSPSRTAWQYNFWAMVVVLLWAQPWSSRDPYRTSKQMFRWLFYLLLFLGTLGSVIVFDSYSPLFITLEIFILAVIEFSGRRSLRGE